MGKSWPLLLCLALCGCADLSPIQLGSCGNAVLEPGEDCDSHTDATLGTGLRCGRPSTPGECRYVCDENTSCPLGWDCGSNGVCSRASNEMVPGPSARGWTPDSFESVDFNGDGKIDLVGGFSGRLEFRPGDGTGSFLPGFGAQTLTVTGDVAAGNLDSDGNGDVLLPTNEGFSVWRGQAEGSPLQSTYAAIAIPADATAARIIPLNYSPVPEGVTMVFYQSGTDIQAFLVTSAGKRSGSVFVARGESLRELGGRVSVADLDGNGSDEIAIGFRGSSGVKIFGVQLDVAGGGLFPGGLGRTAPVVVDVSNPHPCKECTDTESGYQVEGGVQSADVDNDGHLDLLVSVRRPSQATDEVVVALGDGRGAFGEAYRGGFDFLASPTTPNASAAALVQWPLAAGDLNNDAVTDYVSPNGVYMAKPTPPYDLLRKDDRKTVEPWTAATIADVDGDGQLDIVAIAEGEHFVDVLLCQNGDSSCRDTGHFFPHRYSTTRGVTKIRTGWLQGLRAMDIALVENAPEGSTEDDSLSIMYARQSEPPEPPRRQATFHRIEQLEIGRSLSFGNVQVMTRSAEDRLSVGVLRENGAKQLSSAFLLAVDANAPQPEYATAKHALLGRFSGSEHPYADLILFGHSAPKSTGSLQELSRAWWVPGAEGAAFAPTETSVDLDTPFHSQFDFNCARFATGDIDGDGRSEAVVLAGGAVCSNKSPTQLAVGFLNDGRLEFTVRQVAIDSDSNDAAIALSDLDGDGRADLVIARSGSASIFRGGPSGLSEEGTRVELPAGQKVRGIAPIARSTHTRGPNRVAVLTDSSVVAIAADDTTARLAPTDARGLRSSDVNGDGLGDLVLLGSDGVDVLLGTPAQPIGGRP